MAPDQRGQVGDVVVVDIHALLPDVANGFLHSWLRFMRNQETICIPSGDDSADGARSGHRWPPV
jgi:hypothetical protein